MKYVSLMMVTYNRLELTKKMISNFIKTTNYPYRLIIIDNGSTDGTIEWLNQLNITSSYCQGLYLHFNKENKGIAIGRNQGLLIADYFKDPYLGTLDNDVELPNNWLNDCIDIIKTNHKFAVGVNFEGIDYPIKLMNGKPVQWKKDGNLGTACSVFHRSLFETIGYFTMEYNNLYSCEDSTQGFKSRLAGWNLGYLPNNGVHLGIGEFDTGEYRAMKDECNKQNIPKFQKICYEYAARRKPLYTPFEDKEIDPSKILNNKLTSLDKNV